MITYLYASKFKQAQGNRASVWLKDLLVTGHSTVIVIILRLDIIQQLCRQLSVQCMSG